MQLDMHYYGTYAMARAAGLAPETCRMIATAAQFVDDNAAASEVEFRDGARIDAEATAHHVADVDNIDPQNQRRVWVPFHFLPGNEGESYTERLKCGKDSEVVRELVDHHLTHAERRFAEALMGITAHVYGDTFSHYGFSGVSSRGNKIVGRSLSIEGDLDPEIRAYVTSKAEGFFKRYADEVGFLRNIKSWVGETASGGLGHGAVATYPDRPYLIWSFAYENDDLGHSVRNNPETYLEGCRALHGMFRRFALRREDLKVDEGRAFDDIADAVADILARQAPKAGRCETWRRLAESGEIFADGGEEIPVYDGEGWNEEWKALHGTDRHDAVFEVPVFRFYQAAALHRTYVLRDLLPKRGLIVD